MSHLEGRNPFLGIWPGAMRRNRSFVGRTVQISQTQEGVPKAPAHDAEIRSWRFLAVEPDEERERTKMLKVNLSGALRAVRRMALNVGAGDDVGPDARGATTALAAVPGGPVQAGAGKHYQCSHQSGGQRQQRDDQGR